MHVVKIIDGVGLVLRDDLEIQWDKLSRFPDCCGAGDGLGNKLVPDRIAGVRISAACFGHDDDWHYAEPTWEAFHASNDRFHRNIMAILRVRSANALTRLIRMFLATCYFRAVDDKIGVLLFWSLKNKQIQAGMWPGYEIREVEYGRA